MRLPPSLAPAFVSASDGWAAGRADRATFSVVPVSDTTCMMVWTNNFQSNDVAAGEAALQGFVPVMQGLADYIGEQCK